MEIASQAGMILVQLLRPARPGCRGMTAVKSYDAFQVRKDGVLRRGRRFAPRNRRQRAVCCLFNEFHTPYVYLGGCVVF